MHTINSMDDQFINKLTKIIDDNLHDESFGATELAEQLGMSRVTLYRKVKSIIKKSVSEFIRETRLERACEMLQNKEGTVAEISYKVGFSSPPYFNKCFHDYYGFTPGDVLKGICGVKKVNEESEFRKRKRTALRINYLIIFALIIISVAVIIMSDFLGLFKQKELSAKEDGIITIAIPVFESDYIESGNQNLRLFRNDLHGRLNELGKTGKLKVINISLLEKPPYKEMGYFELAHKFKADYVIVGKQYRIGNDSKLNVSMFEGESGTTIWNDNYLVEDSTFEASRDLAVSIVDVLEIELGIEDKTKLEKLPSQNWWARKLYKGGLNAFENYLLTYKPDYIRECRTLLEQAIEADSTFVDAYVQLAILKIEIITPGVQKPEGKEYWRNSGKENAEKALHYDKENSKAWYYLGKYYFQTGDRNAADSCMLRSEHYAVHDLDYHFRQHLWYNETGQHAKCIDHGIKYFKMMPDSVMPDMHVVQWMWYNLASLGFRDAAYYFCDKGIPKGNQRDTATALFLKFQIEGWSGNLKSAEEVAFIRSQKYPDNIGVWRDLNHILLQQGEIEKALPVALQYEKLRIENEGSFLPKWNDGAVAMTFMQAGEKEKAEFIFNTIIPQQEEMNKNNVPWAQGYISTSNLAVFYTTLGNQEKAFEFLSILGEATTNYGYINSILRLKTFDIYRGNPEFEKVHSYIKKQYSKEQNRIKKLLAKEKLPVT